MSNHGPSSSFEKTEITKAIESLSGRTIVEDIRHIFGNEATRLVEDFGKYENLANGVPQVMHTALINYFQVGVDRNHPVFSQEAANEDRFRRQA